MTKIVFSIMIVACLLTLGVGNAMAYSNINELLTDIYGSNYNFKLLDQNTAFDYAPENPNSMNIKYFRPYVVGDDTYPPEEMYTLGAYNVATLAKVPYFGVGTTRDFDFINSPQIEAPLYTFGLYINYYELGPTGPSTTFYSCAKHNANVQYAKVYQILNSANNPIDGKYVVAFDDGDPDHNAGDFMDLVVEIHPVEQNILPIPEFPTVALPVAAVLGLMFVFGRRKQE